MPNPQQEAQGRADAFTSDPGSTTAPGLPDQPTLYEFLTRLVSSADARSAFEADPRAALDQAGLGDMTATDVLQASSLVLDYAPVEVVEEYDRSLQGSVEKFAASTQHVAINEMHPAHPHEQEVTELSMLHSKPDFSNGGDVDQQMPAPAPAPEGGDKGDTNINMEQHDSQNLISVHHVASDNNLNIASASESTESVANTVGDVAFGSVDKVTNTVNNTVETGGDLAAGAGAHAPDLGSLAGDLPLPGAGDLPLDPAGLPVVGGVAESLPLPDAGTMPAPAELPLDPAGLPVVGDVAGALPAPSDVPVVGDVAGALPAPTDVPVVGDVAGHLPLPGSEAAGAPLDLPAPTDLPVVGDVAGALPAPADVPVVGGVAENLPVEDVAGALPAPADLPVVGDVAAPVAEPVQDLAGEAASSLPVDGLL